MEQRMDLWMICSLIYLGKTDELTWVSRLGGGVGLAGGKVEHELCTRNGLFIGMSSVSGQRWKTQVHTGSMKAFDVSVGAGLDLDAEGV